MSGSTISTTITASVTLGTTYLSPLTITESGAILPAALGAIALTAAVSDGQVLNQGTVVGQAGTTGAAGQDGGTGGLGVALSDGTIVNSGSIGGGVGGASGTEGRFPLPLSGGAGGNGIDVTSGSLLSTGTITGGAGGTGSFGGYGGAGIQVGGGTVSNFGWVIGGAGGGVGIGATVLSTLVNFGTILGGDGIQNAGGGIGVSFVAGGTLTTAGFIGGGIGGTITADAVNFGTDAARLILGDGATFDGAVVADTTFSNVLELSTGLLEANGTLTAATWDDLQGFQTVEVDSGTTWTVAGTVAFGAGILVSIDGSLNLQGSVVSQGTIQGESGAPAAVDFGGTPAGAPGVAGPDLVSGILVNDGLIQGGSGGNGSSPVAPDPYSLGALGNTGVNVTSGTLLNDGSILGGTGGTGGNEVTSAEGGIGVSFAAGGTLINEGFIGVGADGDGNENLVPAVVFGSGAAWVVMDPGGTINGEVVADAAFSNVLELAAGTLGGVGTLEAGLFQGFSSIVVDTGATWTTTGLIPLGTAESLTVSGSLTNQAAIVAAAGAAGIADGENIGPGGVGGVGVRLSAGNLANDGQIQGGAGGAGAYSAFGMDGGTGGAGGDGVDVTSGAVLNAGMIAGASGGEGGYQHENFPGAGGAGGAGISLVAGSANNTGLVIGGSGGDPADQGSGGVGGAGVVFANTGTLVNSGSILGGNGGANFAAAGDGVLFTSGGTLTNSGFIGGGLAGGLSGPGQNMADAVAFGAGAGWLELLPGSTLQGGVVADPDYSNTLELATGSLGATGTLVGLGPDIQGFPTILVDAGAAWQFSGPGTIDGGMVLSNDGTIFGGTDSPAIVMDGGTLTDSGFIAGGTGADAVYLADAARLIVESGASFGSAVVAAPASGAVLELAGRGGTLSGGIGGTFQGFGSIVIDPGADWTLAGDNQIGSGTTLDGNGGTLAIDGAFAALTVTGTGGMLQNAGALEVGDSATGELSIENGGTVGATTLNAGMTGGAVGVISISGDNSSLITSGTLAIGVGGAGELSILSGANVNIGGDFDIGTSAGASGNVDIEDTSGTVFVGGNLNLGVNGGVAVLTVGYGSTLEVDNGGVNGGPNAVLIPFSPIDPFYSNGVTYPISSTQVQSFPAYVADSRFNLSQGVTYTLETPAIYAGSGFEIGAGTSDTEPTELVLNAGSFSANSSVTFESAVGTLVVGVNALATIATPISGTSSFTKVVNPDAGVPLIGSFDGTLKQFQAGDVIIVDTSVAATFSQNGSIVSVIANGTTLGALTFDSVGAATAATSSGLENEVVAAPCFAAGTRIATARGEVAVEDLAVGDLLPVVLGDAPEPIVWIGQRTVNCARHPKPAQVWPVRIVAGAFGAVQPHTDLWLSPDHAVYVNDVLIPVKHLINGTSIVQVKVDTVTYYHLELPRHDVLLAEGLAVESYLDMKDGSNYANRPGPVRLYPDFSTRMWDAFGCAKLVVTGPELAAAQALLGPHAAATPGTATPTPQAA